MKKSLSYETISVFFNDVSIMIQSGVPMDEILAVLADDCQDAVFAPYLKQMTALVNDGKSLAQAMEEVGAFPDYALGMIRSAEECGKLEDVTDALSLYYEQRRQTDELVKSALKRPLMLLLIIAIIMAVFILGILPAISDLYTSLGGNASLYVTGSYVIGGVAFGVVVLILIFAIILALCKRTEAGNAFINKLWTNNRITRNLALLFSKAMFISDIDVMMSGGLSPDAAFEQAARNVTNPNLKESAERCAERVLKGENIAEIFTDEKVLPPVCTHILFSALQNGETEEAFHKIRGMLFESAELQSESLIEKTEPILTAFFMLAVGLSLLSIMLPLIGIVAAMG